MIQIKTVFNGFKQMPMDAAPKYIRTIFVMLFISSLFMSNVNGTPAPHKKLEAKQIKQLTIEEKQQQVEILENRVYEIRDLTKERDNIPNSKREELKKELNQIKHQLDFFDGGGIYISGGALLIIIILLILL